MMMYHTQALILRKDEWNEADWLVTALTRDFGKIRLLAQGARKHGAKLQGHLEPGSLSHLSFVIGRNGYRLTTARLEDFFPRLRTSLSTFRALATILWSLDRNLWEDGDRTQEYFGAVLEALLELNRTERLSQVRRIVVWFQVRLLVLLGLFPARDSAEAALIPSLRVLSSYPPVAVAFSDLEEAALEQELGWLARRLGSMFAAPAPISGTDLELYWR